MIAVAAAALVLGQACEAEENATPREEGVASSSPGECADTDSGSTLVLMAASDPLEADLYRVCLDGLATQRLTSGARISSVDAAGGDVVVGTGARGPDEIARFSDGRLEAIAGLRGLRAHTPAASRDGTIVYVRAGGLDDKGVPRRYLLESYDPATTESEVLYSSAHPMFASDWGPDGSVAVVEQVSGRKARVLIAPPDGDVRRMPVEGLPVGLAWGTVGYVAIQTGPRHGMLLDAKGGRSRSLGPWLPLDWAPEGETLLVTDESRRRLGLWDLGTGDVEVLGDPGVGRIYDGGWLD